MKGSISSILVACAVTVLSGCGSTAVAPTDMPGTGQEGIRAVRTEAFLPDVSRAAELYEFQLADGRVLRLPASARISRIKRQLRIDGPGFHLSVTASGVRGIRHVINGKGLPVNLGASTVALPNACVNLDNCCTMNCGGGVGGCDASHQNCGPCPDCGGPVDNQLEQDIECYYVQGTAACGTDQYGNPFGTLLLKFPGLGGLGTTCLWDISDTAYAAGTDLSCVDEEPNILNAPFNGNVLESYVWSRSEGATHIKCRPPSPAYVTNGVLTYNEVEGNLRLTGEHVFRNVLPGEPVAAKFTPSLSTNSTTNGIFTYRAVPRVAAFCNAAGAVPVP